MTGGGTLEVTPEGWGFLRRTPGSPGDQDPYVSPAQIRQFRLNPGDLIRGEVRPPRVHEGERYYGLLKIETINGQRIT
jgi:transcription termination factor Rho